ncbi:MAG TPA: DUF2934 domain-containing protein [Chthoniobacterales bacterium]|jgi:hypothetical protein
MNKTGTSNTEEKSATDPVSAALAAANSAAGTGTGASLGSMLGAAAGGLLDATVGAVMGALGGNPTDMNDEAKETARKEESTPRRPERPSAISSVDETLTAFSAGAANGIIPTTIADPQNAHPSSVPLTKDDVEQRAWNIYIQEGLPSNRALDHWLQAEQELSASHEGR